MEPVVSVIPVQKTTALWRGICGRCPQCGEGMLFKSYLKQNASCALCGEDFSKFRADDGPAWLTIILTLHIIVPTAVAFATHDVLPQWAAVSFLFALTLAAVFLILPRSKGFFIASLWIFSRRKLAA